MKLWPTTTENKCFVKMLWHLLGECIKITILLICSICTVHHLFFFLVINLCSLFYNIFALLIQHFSLFIYGSILVSHFVFFFFFFKALNSIYSTKQHCSYNSFFFFSLLFLLFFPFIYITLHPVFLHCTSTMPFCWVTFFFIKFWTIATVTSWFNQLCWAKIHYFTYNFFRLTFCIFFSLHTILSKNT